MDMRIPMRTLRIFEFPLLASKSSTLYNRIINIWLVILQGIDLINEVLPLVFVSSDQVFLAFTDIMRRLFDGFFRDVFNAGGGGGRCIGTGNVRRFVAQILEINYEYQLKKRKLKHFE